MIMKRFLVICGMFFGSIFLLTGCFDDDGAYDDSSNASEEESPSEGTLSVVATFSIIADMVEQVGGELVNVYTIVPIGEDPHEHEVLPGDMVVVSDADVILYNGMNLETGNGWFDALLEATDREAVVVSEGVTPIYLTTEGLEDYQDPHAWIDIRNGVVYIENITRILSGLAPEYTDIFEANAQAYIANLEALHDEWSGVFSEIPDSERLLVTAEGAFRYFGYTYGVEVNHIWEINAHEEGTPEQMMRIVGIINESNVRVLFTESSVEVLYMEQVSEETGVPIFDMLFTDSLSESSGPAATYYDFMRHNLETVFNGLTGE